MKHTLVISMATCGLAVAPARADLLDFTPGFPQMFFSNQGTMQYDSATGVVIIDVWSAE